MAKRGPDHFLQASLHQEKLAELGRLTAGIAHEINNPLAIIGYALELLCRDGALTPFQAEMAERIEAEIERLKALTGSLLSFSGEREGRRRLVVLNEMLEEVSGLLRFELQRQSVELATDFAELPLVEADPNQLKQIVINLVMNAAHAAGGGGKVVLSTRRCGGRDVELVVADNGPGVPAALREKIFAPFFTTKPEGEGTGLGLYLCRNLVREHGGEILVDDTPGGGATFMVRLPGHHDGEQN